MPNRHHHYIHHPKLREEWAELHFILRARTRPNPLQALRRQRPLRPGLACPEGATATEGTTKATSSASRACPEERQRRMGQMHPTAPREKFLPLRNRPQRHPLQPRPNRLLRHRSLSRAKPRDYPRPSLLHPPPSRHQQPTRHPTNPHRQNSKYAKYKEAWHLLMPEA